jgi:ribonucleoside-triphosphate reductase
LLEGHTENVFGVLSKGGTKPLENGPCDLFRRIQKRDGRIVDFTPSKITEAIFKAAQSVGGKDRRRSETLTEYVILALSQRYQENTNLLNIEQVQDCIERVLVEKGHYRTARAFITYRNERARRRALRGELHFPCELYDGVSTLQTVSVASSHGDVVRWDREKIVTALVRETDLPYEDARKVSHAVEMEIVHSKISHLTAPLIRELTNAKLLQLGFESKRRHHARLGLPVYDVEQRLLGKGGVKGCPDIEGEILRQYALEKVIPLEVADSHGIQDIHIHDLEQIHKPVEIIRDLDLKQSGAWFRPNLQNRTNTPKELTPLWEGFLSTWECEETRLLKVCGGRLIWDNVNTSIAYHAQQGGVEVSRAVSQSLEKLWRHAGSGEHPVTVVWRLKDKVRPHWRGKFIGTRQMVLLPEDDLEVTNRSALLEILRQLEEVGPYWLACGVQFEVLVDTKLGQSPDPVLVNAIADCLLRHVPLRILYRRASVVANPAETETAPLVQSISLNLPRAAVLAGGNDSKLAEWLEDRLNLIAQAHSAKRNLLANRLKAGTLAPLASPGQEEHQHPYHLDQAIFGVGLWGLAEMTRLHRGEQLTENEETLKWLLQIIARLKLRMDEIGRKLGLRLQFVATTDEAAGMRFAHSLLEAKCGYEGQSLETLAGIEQEDFGLDLLARGDEMSPTTTGTAPWETEGKLHSFLAFGRGTVGITGLNRLTKEEVITKINHFAEATHVMGMTWVGEVSVCRTCGVAFGETQSVCEVCGDENLIQVSRHHQGISNQITKL